MTYSGEINFDGLIGPTHNYAGLSQGNLASQKYFNQTSNPQAAALQGLDKMRLIMEQGIPQGFFLPHERPHLPTLRKLGFGGTDEEVINQVGKKNPALLKNIYSASSMWAANAATFSPSIDSYDQNIHVTPANLNSMFHRSIEHEFTKIQLEHMFQGVAEVHESIKNISGYGDEGAANHLRVSAQHLKPGFQIFANQNSGNLNIKLSSSSETKATTVPAETNTAQRQFDSTKVGDDYTLLSDSGSVILENLIDTNGSYTGNYGWTPNTGGQNNIKYLEEKFIPIRLLQKKLKIHLEA